MKSLLPLSSPLYLKRLVRELNALPDGFYCGEYRFLRARLKDDKIQFRYLSPTTGQCEWLDVERRGLDLDSLRDAYGCTVCASRHAN